MIPLAAMLCDWLYIVDVHVHHEHLAMHSSAVEEACLWHRCTGLCLDIDPGPNSDPRIGRVGQVGGPVGSVGNDSASYLPIFLRPNPVALITLFSMRCEIGKGN